MESIEPVTKAWRVLSLLWPFAFWELILNSHWQELELEICMSVTQLITEVGGRQSTRLVRESGIILSGYERTEVYVLEFINKGRGPWQERWSKQRANVMCGLTCNVQHLNKLRLRHKRETGDGRGGRPGISRRCWTTLCMSTYVIGKREYMKQPVRYKRYLLIFIFYAVSIQ